MGTSISFYRGAALTERLRAELAAATGLPCTTMSHAVMAALLRALGAVRVAVATSYIDALNDRLVAYLTHEGLTVTAIEGLSLVAVRDINAVPSQALIDLGARVWRRDPRAQAVFISCGGLLTHGVVEPLERLLGVPVVASSPAGFWNLVRTAEPDPTAQGFGRLFSSRAHGARPA